jgi:hypothetical protein
VTVPDKEDGSKATIVTSRFVGGLKTESDPEKPSIKFRTA